jgi:hypothetical protein
MYVLQDNLEPRIIFDLIASHGRMDMLLHYASIVGDFERIVAHWVQEEEWTKALDVLSRQVNADLWRFSTLLMMTLISERTTSSCITDMHQYLSKSRPKKR